MKNQIKKHNIKELNEENRPRERLKKYGPSILSDEELLAIILRCGNKEQNAKELANEILIQLNGLNNFYNTSLNNLIKIKGVGEAKAITVLAALELGKRALKQTTNKIKINNNKIVYDLYKYDFINCYQEHFVALFLDTKKNLITSETIFKGTVSSSNIHPREIFKAALKNSASSIIVLHNHPTGDSTPSKADIEVTQKLAQIGELMSIPLIDHIIIGNNNYYSFYDSKKIEVLN